VDFVGRHTLVTQAPGNGRGYGDHGARAPQREQLKPLVKPIASSATRESVRCADSSDTMRTRNCARDQIGSVTVGVYDARSKLRDERAEQAIFPKIAP
jgi:hypothetical protein